MTLVTGPDVPSPAAPVPARPGQDQVPVRADGLELIGEVSGSGYRKAPSLVRRLDGQTFQLTPLVYQILDAIDGRRGHDEIAAAASESSGRAVSASDIETIIESKLRPLGLVTKADGSQPEVKKSNPLLALRFRWVVTDEQWTNRLTKPFAVLFNPLIVVPMMAAFVAVCVWTLFNYGLGSATYSAFENPVLLLTVFAISVLSAGFHEFGHAAAARYGGATPGAMGVGLYLVWPAFYTDVTDSYRLGRGGKVRTDLGGVYFNAIFTLAAFGTWWLTDADALLLIIPSQLLQMVQQLTPLMRFDGYHVLADLTGVPDLYQRIRPTLLGLLPWRWRDAESKVLKPWARAVVALWVILVVPFLVASIVLMVLAFPRLLGTAWASLGDQWELVGDAWADSDAPMIAARVLSLLALMIPVMGMVYILVRLVRSLSNTVWRATAEHPKRRHAAKATAALVIVALAYAWWPHDGAYRPVQAWEQGSVGQVVDDFTGTKSSGLRSGKSAEAQVAWPNDGGTLPTRERPAVATVMVPVDDPDAPTWVFPFNRPLPPGEGDNQALAVNTKDGTVRYEVAFALVWARDGSVLNTNEAFAFASCEGCAAVAVGFQVILVVGEVDVAVPQNLAGAVNYACVNCVAYALATQLVITIPAELSPAAMGELAALWEEIRLFGENIRGVALADIQASIESFKTRIIGIIERDVAASTSATTETTVAAATETTAVPSAPATLPPSPDQPDVETATTVSDATTTTVKAATPTTAMSTPVAPAGPAPASSQPASAPTTTTQAADQTTTSAADSSTTTTEQTTTTAQQPTTTSSPTSTTNPSANATP